MYKVILSLLALFLITSCDQKTIGDAVATDEIKKEVVEAETKQPSGELKMLEIQSIPNEMLTEVRSLRYERIDAGETVQVYAYYDKEGSLVKLIEDYRLGKNQNAGLKAYYFEENRVPVAIVDSYEDWTDTSLVTFSEKRTFYENGNANYTDFRTADYYELINDQTFEKVKTDAFSTERVLQILDVKGAFNPHFIGVIEAPNFPYLLVGEPNKTDGFQSTLRVSSKNPFVDDLLMNQDKYLNQPMELEFREIEEDNFVFTEFLSGRWLD